jgi:hypothetical protein
MRGTGIEKEVEILALLPPSPQDGNRSSFRNVVFLFTRIPDDEGSSKTQ